MPPITVSSPLGVAANSAATFFQSQQATKQAQADAARQATQDAQNAAYQNAQMQLAKQNAQLNADKFSHEKDQDTVTNALESAKAVTEAKKQAADELHQAREDALNKAREDYQHDRDLRTYQAKIFDITTKHKDAQDALKKDRDVASIHASATLGAAQIHASATIQAAGMREGGADARQTRAEAFAQAQQTRAFRHADSVLAKKPARTPKLSALQEVTNARKAGIQNDDLIRNELIANGHTAAQADAALQALPSP